MHSGARFERPSRGRDRNRRRRSGLEVAKNIADRSGRSPRYLAFSERCAGCYPGAFTWHPTVVVATTSRSRRALFDRAMTVAAVERAAGRTRVVVERSRPPLLIWLRRAHFGPNGRADLRGIKRDGVG